MLALIKKRKWRESIALALGLAQLCLVGVFATHHAVWRYGRIGRWLENYGRFSGADGNFSFFAPDVAPILRAQFFLYDKQGKQIGVDELTNGPTREINLRVNALAGILSSVLDDEATRKTISASLAAKMFERHSEAARVAVEVETRDLPSMAEYRSGVRYQWEPLYRATYQRERNLP